MLDYLEQIDNSLFLWLHHLVRGEVADGTMWLISDKYVWIPMYIAVISMLWLKYRDARPTLIVIGFICLGAICADVTCARIIRPMIERLRPAHPDNPLSQMVVLVNDYRGGAYGFPSCHAANTFMLATFLSMQTRRPKLIAWMYVWALINCISRIYLGVHYPGDILFGALVGACFGALWYFVSDKCVRTYFARSSRKAKRQKIASRREKWAGGYVIITGVCTVGLVTLYAVCV